VLLIFSTDFDIRLRADKLILYIAILRRLCLFQMHSVCVDSLIDVTYAVLKLLVFEYEGVFKSFRTGRLERELQMVQLSATRCSCIAIL
jgi:hypothetical protein